MNNSESARPTYEKNWDNDSSLRDGVHIPASDGGAIVTPMFQERRRDVSDPSTPNSVGGMGKTRLEREVRSLNSVGDNDETILESDSGTEVTEGRLELLEKLGEGGMGVVWKARDRRLGRFVALKRPKGPVLNTPKGRARFLREARACAVLTHPNIITVYSVSEDREGPFIEMEYIEGLSLSEEVLRHGPFDEARARPIALALCDALALAHDRGIIHRDIKPSNVLLTSRGIPKLGDFGLATVGEEDEDHSSLTATSVMLGTLYYASPEQLRDAKAVSERSDIYSLGATLYYLLTGEAPRRLRLERLPGGLRPVIEKALEERPTDRYPDVKAFERALTEARMGIIDGSCPQCHKDNPLTARHCTHCGLNLKDLFRPCLKCGIENRIDQKFCQGCGANLEILAEIERIKESIKQGEVTHQYEEIIEWTKRGLTLSPDEEAFITALANAREQMAILKDLRVKLENTGAEWSSEILEQRIEILERILTLTPGDAGMQEALAAARGNQQRAEKLRSILQPAKLKREIEDLQLLAHRQSEEQRFDEALATMERAQKLAPWSDVIKQDLLILVQLIS